MDAEIVSVSKNNVLDAKLIYAILKKSKILISCITASVFFISLAVSISMPNIYRAQVLVAATEDDSKSSLGSIAGQFSGIASLAGVNIGNSGSDKALIALEILKSRDFINRFINKRDISVPLIAGKHWDGANFLIDETIYDIKNQKWLINDGIEPTNWDLYSAFISNLYISRDKTTGLITIGIDHNSPQIAKQWVTWLVSDLNQHIKNNEVDEATKNISFLQKELNQTIVADMQKMFYQLIEQQYKTVMLANVREEYMFKILDPAVVPQEKMKPKRTIIVVLSTVLGFFLGVLITIIRYFFNEDSN